MNSVITSNRLTYLEKFASLFASKILSIVGLSYSVVDYLPKFSQLPFSFLQLLFQRKHFTIVVSCPFPHISHHHTDVTAVNAQGVPLDKLLSLDRNSLQLAIQVDIKAVKFVAVLDKSDSGASELTNLQMILLQLFNLALIFN